MSTTLQPTAGKALPAGDTAKQCLQEPPKPQTPPEVRKFRHSNQPEAGEIRVHHGKARDPDVASTLVHGVSTKASLSSSDLLNPPKSSVFQEKLQELREAVYTSRQRAPLGRSQSGQLQLDPHIVFGVRNTTGLDVRELLNPPKSRAEVEREALEAHELYVHSHNHYFVGERINRKYNLPHFSSDSVFGLTTPHDHHGRDINKTLQWIHHDELKELTSNSSLKEETFGILPPSDQYGEVIHRTGPGQFTHGPAPQRSLVNALRHHLKKVNFHLFRTLLHAFSHYDKKGRGLIDLQDLEQVCQEFHLDSATPVLQDLLDDCDVDGDGHISFLEFANFLCWKDRMSIKSQEQRILTGGQKRVSSAFSEWEVPYSEALLRPEDLEPAEPGSSLRVPRTLTLTRTRTGGDPDAFSLSSALIGAVTDPAAARALRSCGVPSVRIDLPAPRLKRVSDRTNYGDTSTAAALLRPHVHAALGVHEQDFLCPRSKHQIAEIFQNIGLDLSQQLFDEAWELASMRSPTGDVCVDHFRNVLKELKAM
ncbi:EF-hand domain-containing family member B [Eucyclogobius newberryi]|uniref:EF-hand domain-containing family member B n=1 Tax=Eucyclogobius newberryi TaxID=166745 RepID=UPI003B5A735F